MRKFFLACICVFLTTISFASLPAEIPAKSVSEEVSEPKGQPQLEALQNLSIEDYEKATGRKLGFFGRLAFKVEKKHFLNQFKKGEAGGDFKWLGFAAGLLYGPIGLLVVYVVTSNRGYRKSAWLGFKIWLLALAVIFFVLLAIAGGKFK